MKKKAKPKPSRVKKKPIVSHSAAEAELPQKAPVTARESDALIAPQTPPSAPSGETEARSVLPPARELSVGLGNISNISSPRTNRESIGIIDPPNPMSLPAREVEESLTLQTHNLEAATATLDAQPIQAGPSRRGASEAIKKYRWKLLLCTVNTVVAAFFGIWLGDEISCLGKARDKIETAANSTGFLPYREECFILPPVVDIANNQDEILLTEQAVSSADRTLASSCPRVCKYW
jgi:hypothetical protein